MQLVDPLKKDNWSIVISTGLELGDNRVDEAIEVKGYSKIIK
jgi:hypothetical protein